MSGTSCGGMGNRQQNLNKAALSKHVTNRFPIHPTHVNATWFFNRLRRYISFVLIYLVTIEALIWGVLSFVKLAPKPLLVSAVTGTNLFFFRTENDITLKLLLLSVSTLKPKPKPKDRSTSSWPLARFLHVEFDRCSSNGSSVPTEIQNDH